MGGGRRDARAEALDLGPLSGVAITVGIVTWAACVLALVGWGGCGDLRAPTAAAACADMEIHYRRAGGWTDTAELDVVAAGTVIGRRLAHATLDTLSRVQTRIVPAEWRRLQDLFRGFEGYDGHYEPDSPQTDGDHHRVVWVCDGEPHEVTVYRPEAANLPTGLTRILAALQSLWQRVLYPLD